MKTKDARYLLNRKRQKQTSNVVKKISHGVVDARSILNSKHKKMSGYPTPGSSRNFIAQKSFNIQKSIPSKPGYFPGKALRKQVKLGRDGNIVITAKSKAAPTVRSSTIPRWTPSDVETADIEHIGIDDVLDMDSLPSTAVGMKNTRPAKITTQSIVDEIRELRNTMRADELSNIPQPTSVYVSNLHASVSKEDIMELFGDVGIIRSAEMIRPGLAVIEYFDPTNAHRACELYHLRLLDGQPMQCQVQNVNSQKSLISQRLGERVESRSRFPPSLSNSRSVHNPQNVRFTVKLA